MAELTFYPDASPESTSVDGYWESDGTLRTWAATTGLTTAVANDSGSVLFPFGYRHGSGDQYRYFSRSVTYFDTSALTGATVDSAVLSLYGYAKANATGNADGVNIYTCALASNAAVVDGDFDSFNTTANATAISYASWSTAGYNPFTLNATGEGNIDVAGISKFAQMGTDDANGTAPGGSAGDDYMRAYSQEYTGNTNGPKLVVQYTPGTTASNLSARRLHMMMM